jgi:hypothetical protein
MVALALLLGFFHIFRSQKEEKGWMIFVVAMMIAMAILYMQLLRVWL